MYRKIVKYNMVTIDYLKQLKIVADWCYESDEDDLNTEFFTLGEEFDEERILEFIDPEEVDLEDEFGLDEFQGCLQDLLQSEWGENTEIKTLCVKDNTDKVLIEY